MINLYRANIIFLLAMLFSAGVRVAEEIPNLNILQDGLSIQQPGIFTEGCYYGKDESASDHAPVIYGIFGTWNIAAAINQYAIQPDKSQSVIFYNHKFRTNKEGDLINRDGNTIGFIGSSEVTRGKKSFTPKKIKMLLYKKNKKDLATIKYLLAKAHKELLNKIKANDMDQKNKMLETEAANKLRVAALNEIEDDDEKDYKESIKLLDLIGDSDMVSTPQYVVRIQQVISVIDKLFNNNKDLMYMALQEVPDIDDQNLSRENLQLLMRNIFKYRKLELSINFYNPRSNKIKSFVSDTTYKKGFEPDVALVSRVGAPVLKQESSDNDNRFVPWCSAKTKSCFVSVHMPHTGNDEELTVRCKDISNMALNLYEKGYTKISFAGDFNTAASKIASVCKLTLPIANSQLELHTSRGNKSNSCGSNEGHMPPYNIDLMIKYDFKQ
jgi:hypothetical protein